MINFVFFMKEWGALILAAASLIIAIASFHKSSKAQDLQNKVNELELRIKQYELEKIETEKAATEFSCVEARVIKISRGNYRLKVWNSGNVTVYNVSASFQENSEIIIIDSKMLFEELEPRKSFEEILIVHFGSARKFKIKTTWEDKEGIVYEKEQMGDL